MVRPLIIPQTCPLNPCPVMRVAQVIGEQSLRGPYVIVAEPECEVDYDDHAPLRERLQSIRPARGNFYDLRECDCQYKDRTSCATQERSLFVIQDGGLENLVLDTARHPFFQRSTRSCLTLPDGEIARSVEQFLGGFSFKFVLDHPRVGGAYYLLDWVGADYLTWQYLRVHFENWQLQYDPKEPEADLIRSLGSYMHVAMAISRERDIQAAKAEKAGTPTFYDPETGEEIIRGKSESDE